MEFKRYKELNFCFIKLFSLRNKYQKPYQKKKGESTDSGQHYQLENT